MANFTKLMTDVGTISKDGTNAFHKYKYTTAASLIKKVQAALAANGMYVKNSTMELLHYEAGSAVVRVTLMVTDGTDLLTFQGIGEGADKGDKSVPKACTNALKYLWAAGLNVAWVDFDDPESDAGTDKASDKFSSLQAQVSSARSPDALEDARKAISEAINNNELNQKQLTTLRKLYANRKKDFE